MQDKDYRIIELENFIWNLLKDKDILTITDIDRDKIQSAAKIVELGKTEIEEIIDKQIKNLEKDLKRKKREDKEKIERQEKEEMEEQKETKKQEDEERKKKEDEEKIAREKVEMDRKRIEEEEKMRREENERVRIEEEERRRKKKVKNQIKVAIGIFLVAGLAGTGRFLVWKNSSKVTDNPIQDTLVISNPVKEYKYEELIGNYIGKYNEKPISIQLLLVNGEKRYRIKGESNSTYMVSFPQGFNVLNFYNPKQGLGEFKVTEEQNIIVLKSKDIRFIKQN